MTGRDRRTVWLPVLAAALLALAACGPPSSPTPIAGSPATAQPSPTPGATSIVVIDPALLAYLPVSVDGLLIAESPEAETEALADPGLASVGSAIAAGIAVDGTSGQFVFAVVVRLLPGAMSEAGFRHWRDTYDDGACSQSDGVAGTAEAQFDGRTVHIGTCNGGVRTYHVWLDAQGILISASAVGDRRLGELLVEGLRP